LTTDHTVRQCTCISEADPDISIRGSPFYFRNHFFLEISKDTETKFKANITRHRKKKNDKHKKGGLSPSGSAYVSLRRWPFDSERDLEVFFRNKYSGQNISKNLIINEKYI
jgi:hypothetical protein